MIMPTLPYIRKKKMVGFRVAVIALLLISVLATTRSEAKSVRLKTITVNQPTDFGTIYGQIHYDEKDLDLALKVEKIIRNDLIKVVNYFQYVPKNTIHFNIDPYLRVTNGNARVFPTNIINLFKFPASNNEHLIVFDDWLQGLVFHEYTHITHLDQTRGFVEEGRKIFGNVAKLLTNIVPRWFTEGIAVWSESTLMNGSGRLSNPLFTHDLLAQFLKKDSCKQIDCLDDPGVYPGGQLSYMAGGHFMAYLEKNKPGVVKCLVENNSDNFPFFLDRVFNECTGNSAQNNFDSFRLDFINNQVSLEIGQEAAQNNWGIKVNNVFGSDDLSKGFYLDGNILYKAERSKKSEALVSYDLLDNVTMMVSKFHYPLSDIVGMTTMSDANNENEMEKYLIVSFNEDLYYQGDNRAWKLINAETLLVEENLPFKNDPSYVIGLGKNEYLTASYIDNKWRIEKQNFDQKTKKIAEVKTLLQLPANFGITYFKNAPNSLSNSQSIFIKFNDEISGNTLVVTDSNLEKLNKIYSSKNYFDILFLNEKNVVVREENNFTMLELIEDNKTFKSTKLDNEIFNRVTNIEMSPERTVIFENDVKSKGLIGPSEIFKADGKSKSIISSMESLQVTPAPVVNSEVIPVESFPKFYHLRPYYWFLATGTSDNLFSIGAMTTFSDPMDINIITATILTYPTESKIGGNLDFSHKLSKISNLWTVNSYLNQEYTQSTFSSIINDTSSGTLSTEYAFLLKRWAIVPGLYVGITKSSDFISDRTTKDIGISYLTQFQAMSYDDLFQSFSLQFKLQNDIPDIGNSFINFQSVMKATGRFHENLTGELKTSFGRLYKDGFTQGVFYGGGSTSTGINRNYEFYGLPYNNAYGNQIFTSRFTLVNIATSIYKGSEFFPIYFKEAHLLLGGEVMKADRIILGNTALFNETIQSAFVGGRLKLNLFYYMPVDLDLVFSNIQNPAGKDVTTTEFIINAQTF
jgi:hypothetical protein